VPTQPKFRQFKHRRHVDETHIIQELGQKTFYAELWNIPTIDTNGQDLLNYCCYAASPM